LLTLIVANTGAKGVENSSPTPQSQPGTGDTPSPAGGPWAPRQHRASIGRKVSARPALFPSSTSLQSLSSQISSLRIDSPGQDEDVDHEDREEPASRPGDGNTDDHNALLSQVMDWLHQEKAKRVARKLQDTTSSVYHDLVPNRAPAPLTRERSNSQSSEKALALDKLERILSQYSAIGHNGVASLRRKHSAFKKYRRGSASDSDYSDSDAVVPAVDATLDNSKTMAYTGGLPETETTTVPLSKQRSRDRENWSNFKSEIVRLAHTLRLKGWRRVPIENGEEVEVVRLSGALTNAVYVVSPPKNIPAARTDKSGTLVPRKPPP
jgi:choline kinase